MSRLLECVVVGVIGFSLSVLANALNPSGIRVGRDYFPEMIPKAVTQVTEAEETTNLVEPNSEEPSVQDVQTTPQSTKTLQRLKELGLGVKSASEVLEFLDDPEFEAGMILLIDARNQKAFEESHIPGAYLFDHYQMDQYIDLILPFCQIAESIVIYCTGGQCEDSEYAATDLTGFGVPVEKMAIFVGGMNEWNDLGYPTATGDRLDDMEEFRAQQQP